MSVDINCYSWSVNFGWGVEIVYCPTVRQKYFVAVVFCLSTFIRQRLYFVGQWLCVCVCVCAMRMRCVYTNCDKRSHKQTHAIVSVIQKKKLFFDNPHSHVCCRAKCEWNIRYFMCVFYYSHSSIQQCHGRSRLKQCSCTWLTY